MKNTITIFLLALLVVVVSFLVYQNYNLNKKVEELSTAKAETKTSSAKTETQNAEPSPFDKPNNDPAMLNQPAEPPANPDLTSIHFGRLVHDFGKIKQGEFVSTNFKFVNTGKKPLFVIKAEGSCGCTVPRWTREAILPGNEGSIFVQFDSHNKKGEVEKTVTVTTNTEPRNTVLTIKSTVVPEDK